MPLPTYNPQRKSERVKNCTLGGGWTLGTPTTAGVTWHTSARRMPRFVLCTTPASRVKKPRARRLSRRHTLVFGVRPMEAWGPQGREGARPSLPRGVAAATCEPQGKADAGAPHWALGGREQDLAPLRLGAKEENQRPLHGPSFNSSRDCTPHLATRRRHSLSRKCSSHGLPSPPHLT